MRYLLVFWMFFCGIVMAAQTHYNPKTLEHFTRTTTPLNSEEKHRLLHLAEKVWAAYLSSKKVRVNDDGGFLTRGCASTDISDDLANDPTSPEELKRLYDAIKDELCVRFAINLDEPAVEFR